MGELLSLMTALLWALGVVLYKKSVGFVPPFALSVFKAIVALVLMVATAVVVGQTFSVSVSATHFIIILLSGALGVGIADTLYFMTLSRIGASRTALVDCLYSPLVILFSALMLDERLSRLAIFGGALILSSVEPNEHGAHRSSRCDRVERAFNESQTARRRYGICRRSAGLTKPGSLFLEEIDSGPRLRVYSFSCAAGARRFARRAKPTVHVCSPLHVHQPCCLIANRRLKHGGRYDVAELA